MKECKKCGSLKDLTCFYKHKNMSDGHLSECKECTKKRTATNAAKKPEVYREFKRRWAANNTEKRRESLIKYRDKNSGKLLEKAQARREVYPVKYYAQTALTNAVRDGKLIKPSACSECGAVVRLHGHHDDYYRPLDIRWLCQPCHIAWHVENTAVGQYD